MHPRIIEIPLPFEIMGAESITLFSFGAMMAIAFLTAAWLARRELNRLYETKALPAIRVKAKPGKGVRPGSTVLVSPGHMVGTIVMIAVVGGIAGAKVFHIFENWDQFLYDPAGMIFSKGGLTFYGGLIVATVGILWYARSTRIHLPTFADAILPTVLLAYGIGRIGCHLAGDGDWGIQSYLADKPGFVPGWLWSETYPNNILNQVLPGDGVYPTSIYEFVMAGALFAGLWLMRKHPFRRGWLMFVTVVCFGAERLLIEQIRVNNKGEFLGIMVTQAEVISVAMIVVGLAGAVFTMRRRSDVSSGEDRKKEGAKSSPPPD